MSDIVRRATFYAAKRPVPRTFHIEADGVTVNITVGLTDAHGRAVTRVDVSPEDDTRGGDAEGRIWKVDGARIVCHGKPADHAEGSRPESGNCTGCGALVHHDESVDGYIDEGNDQFCASGERHTLPAA